VNWICIIAYLKVRSYLRMEHDEYGKLGGVQPWMNMVPVLVVSDVTVDVRVDVEVTVSVEAGRNGFSTALMRAAS